MRSKFSAQRLSEKGFDLLNRLLTYDPEKRIPAAEALKHPYFEESPLPKDPDLMPTWPSRTEGRKNRRQSPPSRDQPIDSFAGGSINSAASSFVLKM